ncbi:DUF2887 domain-containing protein [Nostoc sp. KVJ3]|nr:DUF2887 domain-containing protein [Nostoc sp. KVJ3]
MKRDSIYYQIFKRFPGLIFELVDHRPEQAQNYRFESVEVKETAFRIDGFTSLRKFCREDVEAMLGLNIEETRIYKDLERQTKLKAAARFLSMGYNISEVAKAVDLSVEEITSEVVNSQTPTQQDDLTE